VASLVSMARVVCLLARGQTHTQLNAIPTPAAILEWVLKMIIDPSLLSTHCRKLGTEVTGLFTKRIELVGGSVNNLFYQRDKVTFITEYAGSACET